MPHFVSSIPSMPDSFLTFSDIMPAISQTGGELCLPAKSAEGVQQIFYVMSIQVSIPMYFPNLILWSLSRSAIFLLSSFSQTLRSTLPMSLTEFSITQSIMYPQVPKGISTVAKSPESRMVVPMLANSSALQLPGMLLCPGTNMTQSLCH